MNWRDVAVGLALLLVAFLAGMALGTTLALGGQDPDYREAGALPG